jgi:hypothetical protein
MTNCYDRLRNDRKMSVTQRTGKRKRWKGKHFYYKDGLIINLIVFSEAFKSKFF